MTETDEPTDWPGENEEGVRFLDVRDMLAAGREPFPAVMAAAETVKRGGALWLRAPFEPVPLYSVMAGKGFVARSRQGTGAAGVPYWDVLFRRREESVLSDGDGDLAEDPDEGLVELDLRDAPEPELSRRLLNTLESLRYDDVLLVRHRDRLDSLLPALAEHGFSHRSEENDCGGNLTRVWRNR